MKTIEFRDRSKRAPGGELRIFLGRPNGRAHLRELEDQRDLLRRLAKRGEYDVLQAISARVVTPAQVALLIDRHGMDDYRKKLDLSPAPNVPNLDAHVERFLTQVPKKGTRETYNQGLRCLRDFTVEGKRLGERPWHTVRLHHIKDAQTGVTARYAAATSRTYTAAWSAFFEWAMHREEGEAQDAGREPVLAANPVTRARSWLTVHPTRQRFLTHAEFDRLLEVASVPMKAQYAAVTLCGLRGGEFHNLPPAHVHTTHVHVGPVGSWVPKGYPRVQRGVRDVPVHPERLRPLLEHHREEFAGKETFFVNPRTGKQWIHTAWREQFYRDARAAGLKTGSSKDAVTPHTMRHTFASWLAQADVQLLKIAQLLGDTVDMVSKYYAHLLPSDLDATVLRLFVPLADHTNGNRP